MGDGGECVGDCWRNCKGIGYDVQGSGTESVALQKRELGSNGYDDESAIGVPP